MIDITWIKGFLFLSIVVLAALGVPLARKFLRGLVRGTHLYVVFDVDGRTLVYKNPDRPFEPVDKPLDTFPAEIFNPDRYDTYYNVCWFDDLGALKRCGHWHHKTAENASYCELNGLQHSFVGKILEER